MKSLESRTARACETIAVLAIVAAGAAFRAGLWRRFAMWGDEIYTYELIVQGFHEIVLGTSTDVHPPLYYFLARLAWLLRPEPESIRLVSLMAAVASLPVAWAIGRRIEGPRLGLLLLALVAVSPLHVRYSIEGRNYMLGMLAASLMFLWAIDLAAANGTLRRRPWRTLGYFLASLAALYTHNLLAFVVFASGATLIGLALACRAYRQALELALLHALLLLLYLPWVYVVLVLQVEAKGAALEWMDLPSARLLRETFTQYLPFSRDAQLPEVPVWVHRAGLGFLMLSGWAAAWWARRRGALQRRALILAMSLLLLPLALAYLLSHYYVRVFIPHRSGLFRIIPFFLFPAAAGLALPWKSLRPIVTGLLLFLMLPVSVDYYTLSMTGEMRRVMTQVDEVTTPPEPLFYTTTNGWAQIPIKFYADDILGPGRAHLIHQYLDWLIEHPDEKRPERLLVFDWSTVWNPFSGFEGVQAMATVAAHARSRRLLYTSEPGGEYGYVWIFSRIDWPALLETRRRFLDARADLDALPWNRLDHVGGAEFRVARGFDPGRISPQSFAVWLEGGHSSFRPHLNRPLRPGGYYFVLHVWQAVEDKPPALEAQIGGRPGGRVETLRGDQVAVFSFEVTPGEPATEPEIELTYRTWIPREEGVGLSEQEMGYVVSWYGIVRRDAFVPETYPETPVEIPLGEAGGSLPPGEGAIPLDLPPLDPSPLAMGRFPTYDLLIEAEFERPEEDGLSPEQAALQLWTGNLKPIPITPWPNEDEPEPKVYRTRLPLIPEPDYRTSDTAPFVLHYLAPNRESLRWRLRRLEVVRSHPSLTARAAYPLQDEPVP